MLEGMACGLPVVATHLGGIAEALGEGGMLVPPGDVSALSAALTNLFSEYFAVGLSRGNKTAYTILKGIFLLPVFYLKYLDWFWMRSKDSHRIASTLCATVTR